MNPALAPLRPSFLVLAPACAALGIALAYRGGAAIAAADVLLVLIGAVAAHAAVNALNEYSDFRTGLDARTDKTPFSGGSGALPAHPRLAPLALRCGLAGAGIAAAIGIYFVLTRGAALLPVGLLGLILILAYTPWLTRRPWLCLIAPGLGFGPCMVGGTVAALTGHIPAAAWLASLVPFFLVNNLLLLNQFPDVAADRSVGRQNLPILLGRPAAGRVYTLFFALAAGALAAIAGTGHLPPAALAGGLGMLPGIPVLVRLQKDADDLPALLPCLGLNVVVAVVTPMFMAAGVLLG